MAATALACAGACGCDSRESQSSERQSAELYPKTAYAAALAPTSVLRTFCCLRGSPNFYSCMVAVFALQRAVRIADATRFLCRFRIARLPGNLLSITQCPPRNAHCCTCAGDSQLWFHLARHANLLQRSCNQYAHP